MAASYTVSTFNAHIYDHARVGSFCYIILYFPGRRHVILIYYGNAAKSIFDS